MIWSKIAPILQALVTRLALERTDPLFQGGEWSNQAHAFVAATTQMQLELRITSSTDIAYGTIYTDKGDGVNLLATLGGQRDFILNIQAKSYDQAFDAWAHEYAERIRTRINRDSVQAELLANQITVWEAGDIRDLPGVEDGQATSVASLDLKCRVGFADAAEIVPYFASVEITANVNSLVRPTEIVPAPAGS